MVKILIFFPRRSIYTDKHTFGGFQAGPLDLRCIWPIATLQSLRTCPEGIDPYRKTCRRCQDHRNTNGEGSCGNMAAVPLFLDPVRCGISDNR